MAADVHAVSLVTHGARDAAHVLASLEHYRMNLSAAEQLQGERQSGGTGADDDGCLLSH